MRPNDGVRQANQPAISDHGHSTCEGLKRGERLTFKPRREQKDVRRLQETQPFGVRQPPMARPTVAFHGLAAGQVEVNLGALVSDVCHHVNGEPAALHRCVTAHDQQSSSIPLIDVMQVMLRVHGVGNHLDLSNQRLKQGFPCFIEHHDHRDVRLDGRSDTNGTSGLGLQPSRRVAAVQVEHHRMLASGRKAQFATKRPIAGRVQMHHRRIVDRQSAEGTCCLPRGEHHAERAVGMRRQQRSRPSFWWMFGQGPHDGPDAARRFARPDMDHVRHDLPMGKSDMSTPMDGKG